jgi:hypothetical protein
MHTKAGEGTARRCAERPYNSRRQLSANAAIAASLSRLLVQAVDDKLGTIARQDVLFRRRARAPCDQTLLFVSLTAPLAGPIVSHYHCAMGVWVRGG